MQIEAVSGDITDQHVDAIVNAANSALLGGGGVDAAIHRAAGPSLLEECRKLRDTDLPDGLGVGEAVATGAGDLHARWVVHTVGPNRHAGETDPQLLTNAFTNSLRVAGELGAVTVAFPAVSAGAYGWGQRHRRPHRRRGGPLRPGVLCRAGPVRLLQHQDPQGHPPGDGPRRPDRRTQSPVTKSTRDSTRPSSAGSRSVQPVTRDRIRRHACHGSQPHPRASMTASFHSTPRGTPRPRRDPDRRRADRRPDVDVGVAQDADVRRTREPGDLGGHPGLLGPGDQVVHQHPESPARRRREGPDRR